MGSARAFKKIHEITEDITVNTDAYASGDNVGGLLTFTGVTSEYKDDTTGTTQNVGIFVGATLSDAAAQSSDMELILFNDNPSATTFTNNTALTVADADLDKICGAILINTTSAFVANAINTTAATQVPIPFVLAGSTLYACLVARGTPTYVATTDVKLRFIIQEA